MEVAILSTFVLLSGTLAADTQITTKGPSHTDVKIGGEAILTCKTAAAFRFCSFTHSESGTSYALAKDLSYVDGTVLFEGDSDPEKKTCGIKITNITENQNGEWKCQITAIVAGKTKQGEGFANITVITKPTNLFLTINGVKNGDFRVKYPSDKDEMVTCKAKGARPAPAFQWMIGDTKIEGLDHPLTTTDIFPDGTTEYSETITFKAVQGHNGKQVTCISEHRGYSKNDLNLGNNKVSKTMDVSFKPVSALNDFSFYGMIPGEEGEIKIAFLSHPRPTSVEWLMHDQGKTPVFAAQTPDSPVTSLDGRYTAMGIKEGPNDGFYTAKLKISDVQEKDSDTRNTLIVRNPLGATTYTFTIGLGNPPPAANDLSSPWIGVILGVLLVLFIIGLLFIYNRRHPLCSGSSTQDDTEKGAEKEGIEGSDTESAEDKDDTKWRPMPKNGDPENPAKKSATDRMSSILSAMKKGVLGTKDKNTEEVEVPLQENLENKEASEKTKDDAESNVDKSTLSEGINIVKENTNEDIVAQPQ